ncbi:MAG: copper-binding protein [Acidimicrobiia bacterium]
MVLSRLVRSTCCLLSALAVASIFVSCKSNTAPRAAESTQSPSLSKTEMTVQTYLKEYSIRVEGESAKAGKVTFMAHNEGTMPHELVVIKTDLAADMLPVGPQDTVEEGGAVEVVTEIEPDELSPSMTATKSVDLTPGKYVLICNIAGHYRAGMRAALTVAS